MGRGSYTARDWASLRKQRGISSSAAVDSLFQNRTVRSAYDTRYIGLRESRDSEDSPRSTPIILGFDVTASMGFLAKELAVNALHKTITALYEQEIVDNPQIMCAAIGDCKSDAYPLQVTQFEADIRIMKQLAELCLEGGGGGNGGESYNLLWHFAGRYTKTDAYEKRQKRGVLITVGNDNCHDGLTASEISRVFRDRSAYALSNEELLRTAGELYDIYHIHIEMGSPQDREITASWRDLLGGRATVISVKDIGYLHALLTAIIAIASGKEVNSVLKGIDQEAAEAIARSVALLDTTVKTKENVISF